MATLDRINIVYCDKCGMPPEYCEYGPDFESVCNPWLQKTHPEMYATLKKLRGGDANAGDDDDKSVTDGKPDEPWSYEQRLTEFYKKYQPEKVEEVPSLLEKYEGKEDKLFMALVKKYGPEPEDPYYAESDSNDSDLEDGVEGLSLSEKKKRRGAAAKKNTTIADIRIIIAVDKKKKKKSVTSVFGMETVPGIKLKEVSKIFSKKFAGSSSVKETPAGKKEVIIQGDHMDDVAALIAEQFNVPCSAIFMDIDGKFVAFG
jgi:density-regulated protein